MRKDPLPALSGWDRKMSRNTHAPSLAANAQLTPAGYAEHVMDVPYGRVRMVKGGNG